MAGNDSKRAQLGGRIRELRAGAGLSREQLAAAAGVSVRAVVQWELGEREPGWFNVLALAEALGVDCTAFTQAPAELAAPGLVSPGLRAPVCPPPDGRSPSVRLTRWTARCGAFPRWG